MSEIALHVPLASHSEPSFWGGGRNGLRSPFFSREEPNGDYERTAEKARLGFPSKPGPTFSWIKKTERESGRSDFLG